MSVQNAVPTISFAGLEIEPKATVKFVTNFNEQQRRLIIFIDQLNMLALAIDTEISQSQQVVTDAQQSAITAIDSAREDAKQAVLQIASTLQGLVDDANQSKDDAQSAANDAASNVATQLQALVNTVNGYVTAAKDSKDSAQAWATSEQALADGNKSAKSYVADAQLLVDQALGHAQTAQSAAAGDIVKDDQISNLLVWSSHKISELLSDKASVEFVEGAIKAASTFPAPAPLAPLSGSTAVSSLPLLSGSPYRNAFPEQRVARCFQVDLATGDFSSPVYESLENTNSHTVAEYLTTLTLFKWRCRDETAIENSEWSDVQAFTTDAAFINNITLTVQGAPNSIGKKTVLSVSGFSVHNGTDVHYSTDWLVKKDGVIIYSSLDNTISKASLLIPKGVLDPNTTYTFSARMKGASIGYSAYKDVIGTTVPVFDFAPAFMVSKNGALGGLVFGQDIDTLTPLNPIPLPVSGGSRSDTEFVNDGDFLFCKESGVMAIYKRNISAYIKNPVAFPSPASNVRVFAFGEENGAAIVIAGGNTPNQLGVYNVPAPNASIQRLTTPAPTSLYVQKIVCNVNARHIVVISANASNTTYISVYYRNGGTVTKVQNWGYGATNSRTVAISPSGHRMILFVAGSLYFYGKNANHTYSQVATPPNWVTSPYGMSFSPDGRFFAAYDGGSARLTIYSISGNTFVRITYVPERFFVNSKFSKDGEYLMITNTTDGLILYKKSGSGFVKLPSSAAMIAEKGTKLSWIGEQ